MERQRERVRLKDRRRKAWSLKMGIYAMLLVVVLGGVAYAARLPAVTITDVTVEGAVLVDSEAVKAKTLETLQGTYALLVPKRMALLASHAKVARVIKESFPQVSDVEVRSSSMTMLVVTVHERAPLGLWCSATLCYSMDRSGYIYDERAPDPTLRSYFGLVEGEPVGATFLDGSFEELDSFISQVEVTAQKRIAKVTVTAERDVFAEFADGGEVRFVLEKENTETLNNIASVFASQEFQKGVRLLYADFRFDNKAVVKFSEE